MDAWMHEWMEGGSEGGRWTMMMMINGDDQWKN